MNNTNDEMKEIVYEAIEKKENELRGQLMIFGFIGVALYLLFGAEVTFKSFVVATVVLVPFNIVLIMIDKVRERKERLNELEKKVEARQ